MLVQEQVWDVEHPLSHLDRAQEQCWIQSQNDGQTTLKVKVNDLHFQYQPRESHMHIWCKFGGSSPNPLQVITQTS